MKKIWKMVRVVLIVALILVVGIGIYQKVRMTVVEKVIDTAMENADYTIVNENGEEISAHEIIEQLDEEDEKKVNALLDKYITLDTAKEIQQLLSEGKMNSNELGKYLNEKISEEDIAYLQQLYQNMVTGQ